MISVIGGERLEKRILRLSGRTGDIRLAGRSALFAIAVRMNDR
jgi:hypothetical protein